MFGVAVKALIVSGDKLLILYKTKDEASADFDPTRLWDLPGGRIGLGESPTAALVREVDEESGLAVDILGPAFTWHHYWHDRSFQLVGITYVCRYVSGAVKLSPEHTRYEWFSLADVANTTWSERGAILESIARYGLM